MDTLDPEVMAAIPRAWEEREAGTGPGHCPVCLAEGHKPGIISMKVDPRTGACYSCRRCKLKITARAIQSLASLQSAGDIQ